jgi:hypothetical protein
VVASCTSSGSGSGWRAGGLYALCGAFAVAELGAGSFSQQILSLLKAVAFLALSGACLLVAPLAASRSNPLALAPPACSRFRP